MACKINKYINMNGDISFDCLQDVSSDELLLEVLVLLDDFHGDHVEHALGIRIGDGLPWCARSAWRGC